jgi:hypothetical protein
MDRSEISVLLHKTKQGQFGSKIETYKKPQAGARHRLHRDGEPA